MKYKEGSLSRESLVSVVGNALCPPFTLLLTFVLLCANVSLTFLCPLTLDLSLLFLPSGSVLTRPNGRRPNQGLPSLLPREQRLLVSLLSTHLSSSLFPFLFLVILALSACDHVIFFLLSFHVSVKNTRFSRAEDIESYRKSQMET